MNRVHYLKQIENKFTIHNACGILGARQVGKTTLAKLYAQTHYPQDVYFFDLENPTDLALLENPLLTLTNISQSLIVIDEVQRRPDLFPVLRILLDQHEKKRKFLILGSASRELLRQSSETLAGRIGYVELPPFALFEVNDSKKLWLRGGFPRAYLAQNDVISYAWREDYISSFLERDIPNLGFNIPAAQMRRFWLMLSHYHGQIFNAAEIGRSLGISDHLVRKYLDVLAGTFMIRIIIPWYENINKRQVRSPKIYFTDTGILNTLLLIRTFDELFLHPRLGSFWEGFALEEIIRLFGARTEECFFWATQSEAELDLLLFTNGKRLGFEFKYTDSPKITKSMNIALKDLSLDHLLLLYPGDKIAPLSDKITLYGLETIATGEFMKHLKIIV